MEVREIELDSIKVSQFNVRKNLNTGHEDASIDDLAASISEQGLLNPVVVRTTSNDHYELIVGQRRFLACERLGRTTISATVRDDLDDIEATIVSLVENVQRADMNPMDKAKAFVTILSRYGNHKRVARETGVSVATIRKYAKLLNFAPEIQDAISKDEETAGVETLAILADTFDMEDQVWVLNRIRGFNQSIQQQILKESSGDPGKIPDLVERALDGAFNVRMCREGLCFKISDEWKAEIKRKLGTQQRLL